MTATRRQCRWCLKPVKGRQRYYCGAHCAEQWRTYGSAARRSDEEVDDWMRGHLVAMGVRAAQDGDVENLIRIRRELRQVWGKPAEAEEIDAVGKELLEAFA